MNLVCWCCGELFNPKPDREKFCSRACNLRYHMPRVIPKFEKCPVCSKEFRRSSAHPDQKTCSKSCASKLMNARRTKEWTETKIAQFVIDEYKRDRKAFRFDGWQAHVFVNRHFSTISARGRYYKDPKAWNEALKQKRLANPQPFRDRLNRWKKSGTRTAVLSALADRIRARVGVGIKRGMSGGRVRSLEKLCGCTLDHLVAHIESQFTGDMTWKTWGKVWHLDHIIPCASFNLEDEADVLKCCHWTNLQPLLAVDNMRKGKKMPQAFQNFSDKLLKPVCRCNG